MNAEEIVKALRIYAACDDNVECEGCQIPLQDGSDYKRACVDFSNNLLPQVADLIESLQAQLDKAISLIPRECSTCANWDKSDGKPDTCKVGGCGRFYSPEKWEWNGKGTEQC